MHFQTFTLFLGAILTTVFAQTPVSVSYDQGYDNANFPISEISCSNSFGSATTLGQIPAFANIGGSPTVSGFGSPSCGKCYAITYQGTTVNVLAVDKSTGFNIGLGAMNRLTDNRGVALGRVNAVYTEVDVSDCVAGPPDPAAQNPSAVEGCHSRRRNRRS